MPSSSSPSIMRATDSGMASSSRQDLDGQEEAGQAALGVGAAPGHHRRADPGQVADLGRERRRGPVRLLGRLHVVHAVAQQPRGARRAGQLPEDQRVARRLDQLEGPAGTLDPGPGGLGDGPDPSPVALTDGILR